MSIEQLRSPKEQPLFVLSMIASIFLWLALVIGTLGIGLIYIVFGVVIYLVTASLFLARIKGNGVRITPRQFPELHRRIVDASKKLGLAEPPEAFLLNDRGFFNAFATRFLGRNFVVLYAELLESCDEEDGSIDFIVGHEIGHLAFGHLRWSAALLPSRILPLLGPAYSRAREYSCDRAGAAVAGDVNAAIGGLAVLAAGGRYAKRLDVDQYLQQRLETGNFWMAVLELGMSHPFLPKRVGALVAQTQPGAVPEVARNPASYVFAPFFAASGAGGAAASMMIVVAMVGMLAAIAIPNFIKYQQRAAEIQLQNQQNQLLLEEALEAGEGQDELPEGLEWVPSEDEEAPAGEEE